MKNFSRSLFILIYCSFTVSFLSAQVPVFNSVTPNTNTPAKLDKFELNIDLTAGFTNPYDYDDAAVQCTFTAPGGRSDVVDGFFMQDYTLDGSNNPVPSGTGSFKVRYAPNETGTWSYVLSCTNSSGTTTQPAQTFQCVSSNAAGFIRKNTTNYLSFDNGQQYIPIGENMGWQDGNVVTDYTNWMTKLTDNGGNFIRIWMSSWAFGLEWKNGANGFSGLKKYKQTSAFYLDWLLDYCRQKNVYLMLELNNHGQVSTNVNPEWTDNPYNAANGGPATNTWDFFTNPTAKGLHKNRLRYIIARYGYSQNIQSWELFNEVEWTDQYDSHKTEVKDWHQEMAGYIKSKDVYQHLVTTSFAHDYNDDATWAIPAIDFTQTHYYVNSSNIETSLASGVQSYLTKFQKPTINGEFGLGPDGATLITDDPTGVHIHNAIWGSTFSGAMGSAMTWWWDSYIDPQNLYYYYKPLSSIVSLIKFKDDNYKSITAITSGGGVSDVSIAPGANFVKAPASDFTIDASGNITPDANQLSAYLFGNIYNTEYRNPPTFHVNYPIAGQFKVVVTTGGQGTLPQVDISLDGTAVLSQAAVAGGTYFINVPAGMHDIKVDNLGTDWLNISSYVFTNIGSPLSTYVLKSANSFKATGWVLNNMYNWKNVNVINRSVPAPVSGSTLLIPGMQNGNYTINFYSASTADLLSTVSKAVSNNTLTLALPDIAWDIAFTVTENSLLPIQSYSFTGEKVRQTNVLHVTITESLNVKTVYLERSANGTNFNTLMKVSDTWSAITGQHNFADNAPLRGNNFYRLKILDSDGVESFSWIVKVFNGLEKIGVGPNPFSDHFDIQLDPGKYFIQLINEKGNVVFSKPATVNNGLVKFPVKNVSPGIYFIRIVNEQGTLVISKKVVK